jgi:signal transduction histidine kinase
VRTDNLDQIIFRHYTRSALMPILTIELLLLLVYFLSNAYNGLQTERTLKEEVRAVMPHLVSKDAASINDNFALIARQTAYFGRANTDIYNNPNAYRVSGEEPAFATSANGCFYQTNLRDGSSLFISATTNIGPRQRLFAEKTAVLNPLYRHLVRDTPNVVAAYLNTPDNMNRLYPFMDKVYEQYPRDLNMADYNFFYLADAKHDPARQPVWTGVYLDPAGQGWMLSCVAPVYTSANAFAGVVGLDVTVKNIVTNVLNLDLPWQASAFLADDSGMILAMSEEVESLLGLTELKSHVYDAAITTEQLKPEEFSLLKSSDPRVAAAFRNVYASSDSLHEISVGGTDIFLVQSVIPETGWRLMVTVKKPVVYASVNHQARVFQTAGLLIIIGMLGFYVVFFFYLRRKAKRMATMIAEPVAQLTQATAKIGTEQIGREIEQSGILELDQLTNTFNTMAKELDRRSQDLVNARVREQVQGKEAELAYARGQYESASGYLHNVGNAITRLDSNLLDLDTILASTEQYPEVFERLRTQADPGMLARFEEVLVDKSIPGLRTAIGNIARIKSSIQQTIAHQQADFSKSAHRLLAEPFSLSDLVESVCDEHAGDLQAARITLHRNVEPAVMVTGHRNPFRQGVQNLIKNAIEAIGSSGEITVGCRSSRAGAIVTVSDTGSGISPEHVPLVMSAGFTTKPNGHGLGLHSFAVFLSASGGRMSVNSAGSGLGATVQVEVAHAA